MAMSLDHHTRLGRSAPRLQLDLTASFVVGTQSPRPARVINLSHTGCYLATPEPPEVGARVRLLIAPPEAMGPEMMTADAMVRWINLGACPVTSTVPPGMGLQFIVLGRGARLVLIRVLDHGFWRGSR